jgi:hypothetical protein
MQKVCSLSLILLMQVPHMGARSLGTRSDFFSRGSKSHWSQVLFLDRPTEANELLGKGAFMSGSPIFRKLI